MLEHSGSLFFADIAVLSLAPEMLFSASASSPSNSYKRLSKNDLVTLNCEFTLNSYSVKMETITLYLLYLKDCHTKSTQFTNKRIFCL